MSVVGKYRAGTTDSCVKSLNFTSKSAGSHRIDIAGVASSILATPTVEQLLFLVSSRKGS
jgi:hypothetical protein